jgi:hypothetical protein
MFIHNLVIIGIQWMMLQAGACWWFSVAGNSGEQIQFLVHFKVSSWYQCFFHFFYTEFLPNLTKFSKIIRIYSRKKMQKNLIFLE